MSAHTRTAILLGGGTAAACALLIGSTSYWLVPLPVTVWAALFAVPLLIGAGVALVVHQMGRMLRRYIRRITSYLCDLSEVNAADPPRLGFGLLPVATAAGQKFAQLHERIAGLERFRRALELKSRVTEAERGHLEAILNAISDGVVVTDAFNEVSLANGAAARLLRFDLDQSIRRPLDEVTEDARLVKFIKDSGEAGRSMRRSIEHNLGGDATYQVTTTCVGTGTTGKGGGGAGVVTVLRDVTKDREIAAMKSDFVSRVSHELRTPLSSIKAYMELLVDGEAHDEQTRAEFYGIVQNETERLHRLIDNILSISRIESGVTKVSRGRFDLADLVRECVDVLQPQVVAKRLALTRDAASEGFTIFADRDMLYQAVLNVVSNAIKYTPDGGSVGVALEADPDRGVATVVVADTGAGIPADDMPFLFQKFYRVASNNRLAKGTGLGLNLVKHVVENVHDGRVEVESAVGRGSTFKLSLPMADNPG